MCACAQAHACEYQTRLRVLLQMMIKSYEMGSLIEVKSSLIYRCSPFIKLRLSWLVIKYLASFKAWMRFDQLRQNWLDFYVTI